MTQSAQACTVLTQKAQNQMPHTRDFEGMRVLVTAGPTREAFDPVRFISNRSTGKMGYALARAAHERGAQVTLISGPVALKVPEGLRCIHIESAQDMFDVVREEYARNDVVIKAAAVADWRPAVYSCEKLKKSQSQAYVQLEPTPDILQWIGTHRKDNQIICGFAMETSELVQRAHDKLLRKNLDLICANSLSEEGAGFAGDTNRITLISRNGTCVLPLMSKIACAHCILDALYMLAHKREPFIASDESNYIQSNAIQR